MICLAIPTVPNGGNHTAEFEKSVRTVEAHNATLTVVKGLALLGIRALDDDRFFDRVSDIHHCKDTIINSR